MDFMSREEFDSIVKHHISPVVGRVRLNPQDPSYTDHLNTAYDRIFEDFNKFFEPADYPKTVEFEGVAYSVNVNRDSDGEIQYFQLVDSDDEFFFEMDWSGPVYADNIIDELTADKARSSSTVDTQFTVPPVMPLVHEVLSDEDAVNKRIVKDFDFLYSDYADYPDEFKIEVMDRLSSFSDESSQFQRILVSEAAEDWDDEHEND